MRHLQSLAVFTCLAASVIGAAWAQERLTLENTYFSLSFDRNCGTLCAIENKRTGETYEVRGDEFALEAVEFQLDFASAKLISLQQEPDKLVAKYEGPGMTVEVVYTLKPDWHFAEKQLILHSPRPYGLKKAVVSRPTFSADGLRIVEYRYPKFGRPPGKEPCCTFFGRTPKGGFFVGLELPYDSSVLEGQQITLGYAPSLKVGAEEKLACEPAYFGVYARGPGEVEQQGQPFRRAADPEASLQPERPEDIPLQSEFDAMVAMTSAILGPPRHGLVPMACGWHCEMEHGAYASDQAVEGDMKSLDFLAECGIDWVSDSHPWGGETEKMNSLTGDQPYEIGPRVRRFLEHARKLGIKVMMWPTMNNTHPWSALGRPFRPDKPEWLLQIANPGNKPRFVQRAKANCLANRPFFEWILQINAQGLASGYYDAWCMDGSFFGDGGWYTSVIPVDCASDAHDHLPGDSNYACQRALAQWIADVRRQYPRMYIFMCRPPMDLGIWALKNVDACFTLLESGTGKSNVAGGDAIRTWSRVRVHRDFFPHYLDTPLLFPSRLNRHAPPNWPRGKLDYILLSALSCSTNLLFYLPTKTGIPDEDKAEIRKWLDWGRKNVAYLQVRKDLPDWPGPRRVDGSAHIVGDRGFIFLFNPNTTELDGQFDLTEECIGLKGDGTAFRISQVYPTSERSVDAPRGSTVRWTVPGETAVILNVQPSN